MFPCPAYITEGSCLKLGICLGPRAQPAGLLSRHLQVAWAFAVSQAYSTPACVLAELQTREAAQACASSQLLLRSLQRQICQHDF